ncbi:MAG: lipopolysaccharide kinase InaA family protein [Porphyromonadaceae bacterium]|nr:lipopolysaccharide kinase InaA family protein [Porphyromonadaceae bacterium]
MSKFLSSQAQGQRISLHEVLERVITASVHGDGLSDGVTCTPIYEGRNTLYRVQLAPQGLSYAVKYFGQLSLWRRLYYSYVGRSKAERSFVNATRLLKLGISTPAPIGYQEGRNAWGLLGVSSYSCELLEGVERGIYPHVYGWAAPKGFLKALARFIAHLHEAGVEHLDLSPGNVMYRYHGEGGYTFYLIDLNRMYFRHRPLTLAEAASNLARLFVAKSVSSQFACHYADARDWKPEKTKDAINTAADAFWIGRLGKLSRRWCKQVLGVSLVVYYLRMLDYRLTRAARKFFSKRSSFYRSLYRREVALYARYLAAEDIRHALRAREGYGYTIRQ